MSYIQLPDKIVLPKDQKAKDLFALYVLIMSRTRTECGFTLKGVRDMIRTYSQMHRTDKYSEHSSIIWPVWLNG